MGATRNDLGDWRIGETIRFRTNLVDSPNPEVATPIPLDGTAAPRMQWRAAAGAAVLASATCTVVDLPTGEILWVTETAGMPPGRVLGEGWLTLPSGERRVVLILSANLVAGITEYPATP